jgi:hypothetical protein
MAQGRLALLFDPQTSGGLLLCVPPSQADRFGSAMETAQRIGEVLPPGLHPIILR